jgi:DNA mismatch endonuclease (patch repair protein)
MSAKRDFIRDSRSPRPLDLKTSKQMSRIGAKDTMPEKIFRASLRSAGLRGYRLHRKDLPGRPDIAFIGRRITIFIHGCYWHRCPHCELSIPKNNREFWVKKFERNKERDLRKELALKEMKWQVLTFWECEIKKEVDPLVERVKTAHDKSC